MGDEGDERGCGKNGSKNISMYVYNKIVKE